MKISFNWLKNYLDFDLTPERTSEILTDTGLEIEGLHRFEEVQGGLEGIVVGEIISCEQHPDADRLKVTEVNLGEKSAQIVCGAPNVLKGQKVLVATVGTTLYPNKGEAFKIKKAKIRGVESSGMICAEDEIGLGGKHEGIRVLPDATIPGQTAASFFKLYQDHQMEIGLTPNRCDAMGHIGVARDLKAFLNFHENLKLEIKLPKSELDSNIIDTDPINIIVDDPALCSRYIGAVLSNVKVGPSPKWLQDCLKTIGLEPVNNVIDITNFVMYEFGTPMHAFDRKELGTEVTIKKSTKGAHFKTLDSIERTLNGEELMITSKGKNLSIAGVFGGLESGITEDTKTVFLESAIFNATSVRKTSKAHGLQTDASFRFERGVDPSFTMAAMERAIGLLREYAHANIVMKPTCKETYIEEKTKLNISIDHLNKRLGTKLSQEEVVSILINLDFKCTINSSDVIQITVPEYRIDVNRFEDVLEEVLRIYGFNKVELPKKWNISFPVSEGKDTENMQRTTSEWFVSNGFNEVLNNSLRRKDLADTAQKSVEILNPLSKELETMRRSLFFGLLENINYNQNRQQQVQRLFEFGKSYHLQDQKYNETRELAFAIWGKTNDVSWQYPTHNLDFFNLKQSCESLLTKLGIRSKLIEGTDQYGFFERSYCFYVGKESLIEFGEVKKEWSKKAGIKAKAFIALCNWDLILKYSSAKTTFKELPKTFFIRRDFSLILDQSAAYSTIEKLAYKTNNKLLKNVALFDVYEGDKLPDGKKSYAVSFMFQDEDTTLQDSTIDPIMERIRMTLEKELGAELRA